MSKNVEHQMKGENLDMGDKLLRSSLHNSKVNIRKVYIKSIKSKNVIKWDMIMIRREGGKKNSFRTNFAKVAQGKTILKNSNCLNYVALAERKSWREGNSSLGNLI